MKIDPGSGEFCLADNQPLSLRDARGVRVVCTTGILWLTVEGEAGDVFLHVGQSHRIISNGLALVESIGGGRIRLERPRCLAGLRQHLTRLTSPWYRAGVGLS